MNQNAQFQKINQTSKKSVKTENKKSINSTPSETIDLLHNTLKKIVSSNIEIRKYKV